MKFGINIVGDIARIMEAETRAGEKAVTAAMHEASTGLKTAWRAQITGAGLGSRLARTIRSAQYPKGRPSLNAAALVWSKAPVIVGAHDTGPLIRSKSGFWLAIPMPKAGKSLRGGRITPGEWERRTGLRLRFIYRRTGPSLLVADNVRVSKPRARKHHPAQGRPRLEPTARPGDRRDVPAGAAGETAKTSRSGAGCASNRECPAGDGCGELGRELILSGCRHPGVIGIYCHSARWRLAWPPVTSF